jgi:hypothetical protein
MNDSKPTSKPVTPPGFGPRGLLLGSRWCPLYVVIWPGDLCGYMARRRGWPDPRVRASTAH